MLSDFDFATSENVLVSGDWVYENKEVVLDVPVLPDANGVVFTILEAQFFIMQMETMNL